MNLRLNSNTLAAIVICLSSVTSYASAQTHTWTNALGGIFDDNGNWDIGVPGVNGTAVFDLNQTYNVQVTSDIQIQTLRQEDGGIKYFGGNLLKMSQDAVFQGGAARVQDSNTELQAIDDILVGGTSNPLFQVENGANVLVGDDFNIAQGNSSTLGTVNIVNNGTRLDIGANLNVGYSGTGSLSIESGAVVSNTTAASIGLVAGSNGDVTVTGPGSHWDSSSQIAIGLSGQGTLDIMNTGMVDCTVGLIGASNTGTATVDGLGSQWNSSSNLQIGVGSDGTLNIQNEGSVSTPQTAIGRNDGGVGETNIIAEDSELRTDELFVGVGPTGGAPGIGTLNLQSGGDVFVGDNAPATNTGSNLYVSNVDTPSMMEVGNGSTINNDGGAYIGYNSNAFGEVTIDDAAWFNGDTFRVGFLGTGTLNIQNGADVILPVSKSVLVATNLPATGVLNVDGAGSTLTAGSVWACTRGDGTMNVTNGGVVNNATGNGLIAGIDGIGNATINGNGSRWLNLNLYLGVTPNGTIGGVGTLNVENNGAVFVGNNVPGITNALVVSDGGTNGLLDVRNGSQINSRDAFLGYGVNSTGVVDISGTGTEWNVVGDLTVGRLGAGSLNISDNALVDAQETFVNDLSEIIMNNGQLDVGSNMSNEGLLHFTGGTSQVAGSVLNDVGGDIMVDAGARAVFNNRVGHVGNPILVDGEIFFMDAYLGQNAFTGTGDVNFAGILRPYNAATGQIFFAGGVNVNLDTTAHTEIDIASTGDFDSMTVSGDLTVGGDISINWLGGFAPSLGQEFLIANVIGNSRGQFTGKSEGEMITQVGTVGVFISYTAGNGNDVALYTQLVPEVVVPAEFTVIRGTYVAGDLTELASSDNADVSIRRSTSDIQSRTEFEVASFATSANPSFMSITVEGSVFARSNVVQTIQAYNFDTGQFEDVDIRNATRFTDSSTTVELTGNLSRYVEDITDVVVARIRYQSTNPRQQFSSNTDLFTWGFAD